MDRRHFLKLGLSGSCVLAGVGAGFYPDEAFAARGLDFAGGGGARFIKEARHYEKKAEEKVLCKLCPRECSVADRERGYCGVRENRGGVYYTLVWGRSVAAHVDPIEKKPLFHYLPGTTAFSIATAGCNVECKFCQNWNISQYRPEQIEARYLPPRALAARALASGSPTIAYTYTEPVIFYEYVYDSALAGRERGVSSVMISNGYIHKEPMEKLAGVLGAVKIDLKAFTEKFYKEQCHGKLKPVLDTLLLLKKSGVWFEIVVLVIPTLNDSPREAREMAAWIKGNLGPEVPVHFTRFHPTYKIQNLPRTPVSTLVRCREAALAEGLRFVYLGNVPGHKAENTYCPKCAELLIRRIGMSTAQNKLVKGACPKCRRKIPGVWKRPGA